MKFENIKTISINLQNGVETYELADILRFIAQKIEDGNKSGNVGASTVHWSLDNSNLNFKAMN